MQTHTVNAYELHELSDAAKKKAIEWYRDSNGDLINDLVNEDMTELLSWAGVTPHKIAFSLSYCQGDGASFTSPNLDISHFIFAQEKLALQIANQRWVDERSLDLQKGDSCPADLKAGEKIHYRHCNKDPGDASSKGRSHILRVWRSEDPCPDDVTIYLSESMKVLGVFNKDGKTTIWIDSGGTSENVLTQWRTLQFPELATLKHLLATNHSVSVSIGHNNSRYCHYNTMTVNVEVDDGDDESVDTHEVAQMLEVAFNEWAKSVAQLLEKTGYSIIEDQNSDEAISDNIEANDYMFLANGHVFHPTFYEG